MPNRTTVALLMVQLPLTDLRALLPTDVGKSLRPVWLAGGAGINEGNADFLRGLGAVRKSVGADNGGWPPRQQYVRANSGLKFPTLAESLVGIGHSPSKEAASGLTVTKVDRRFFGASDSPRAFIEVVFTLSAFPDCAIPIADLLDAVAALQTRIAYRSNIGRPPSGTTISIDRVLPLAQTGAQFARLLSMATTRASYTGPREKWWVSAQTPLVAVSVADRNAGSRHHLEQVTSDLASELFYSPARRSGVFVDSWVDIRTEPSVEFLQHLSRFHVERVTLTALAYNLALGRVRPKRSSVQWSLLEDFLDDAGSYLNREVRGGRDQRLMLRALDAELSMQSGEWEQLRGWLRRMRPDIKRRVATVINNIQGDQIMAEGDVYRVRDSKVGVVGPHASVGEINFNKSWQGADLNIDSLTEQLSSLLQALKEQAESPEELEQVVSVSRAKAAAESGDGPKALQYLAATGRWVLSVAEKIGVGVATAALRTALGV